MVLEKNDDSHLASDVAVYSYSNCLVTIQVKPLNPELNPICCLLALLGAHHFLHVSRIRVKSYIWSTYS